MITVQYWVRVTMGRKVVLQNWYMPAKHLLTGTDAHPDYIAAVRRAVKGSTESGSHNYDKWVEYAAFNDLRQAVKCEQALEKIKRGDLT